MVRSTDPPAAAAAAATVGAPPSCPQCAADEAVGDDGVERCKCGSTSHRRVNAKDCPLNPKAVQLAHQLQLEAAAAAEAAAVPIVISMVSGREAYSLIGLYRRLLAGVQQPGWEGSDVMALSPAELANFPENAFLQHNRVVVEAPTIKIRAKATALESTLAAAKRKRMQLRKQVRINAASILRSVERVGTLSPSPPPRFQVVTFCCQRRRVTLMVCSLRFHC
jgi:hypothetical protein